MATFLELPKDLEAELTPEELEKVSDLLRSGAGSMEEKPEDEGSDALVVEDIEADQKAEEDD